MNKNKKNEFIQFRMAPTTQEEYKILADELIHWANQKDSLIINSFPISIMMPPKVFYELPTSSEYFAHAFDIALQIVGERREKLAQEGIIDKQIVLQTMPLYNPNYRRWLMSLKDKTENKGETKFIVVEIPKLVDKEPTTDNKIE